MDEPPVATIRSAVEIVSRIADSAAAEAVEQHEHRLHCHRLPPPNDDPITHIPYAEVTVDDDKLSHAIEMLRDHDDYAVAAQLDIPVEALLLALADYRRRFGRLLSFRARTI